MPEQKFDQFVGSVELSSAFRWQSSKAGIKAFLMIQGNNFAQIESARYLIVGLGHVSNNEGEVGESALRKAERYLQRYSRLPVESLEGSFSLIVVDKTKKEVTIYRNIAGVPVIYYFAKDRLTLFSNSISYLIGILSKIVHQKLTINRSQLPHHFLHWRTIWGETLFKDIRRMLLGEQICLEAGKVSQMQMLRFSNMKIPLMKDSVEHLGRVMANIIKEYATTYPNIVNIFSGGVDSSYVQAHLSQYLGSRVRTFSLALLHPSKIWALERQNVRYGISFFKTDHTFVKVIPSEYPTLLINTISDLGLPIRNPQTALLSKLFSSVTKTSSTALCGMCADVLFGLDLYQDIDIAYFIEKIMPFKNLREILLKIGKSLHKKTDVGALERFTKILQLELHDRSSPKHPFNVRDEARFKAAVELFGSREVSRTIFERQALMKRYQIEGSLKECFRSSLVAHCTQGAVESFYELASNVGLNILFPYLDSRMIKTALSMRETSRFPPSPMKKVIKDALRNHLPSMPRKSGWGLPIFEWMAPRGILYPLIKELEDSSFARYVGDAEKKPDSFIWNLLNFNVWHKRFFGQPA